MNIATHLSSIRARPVPVVKEPPLQAFIEIYLRNHVAQLSMAKAMTYTIRRYFVPFHTTPLSEVTPIQIEDWLHAIGTRSPSTANKCLSILRTMFQKAHDWRLFTGDNPCVRIKKYRERSRKRFVQPQEMPRLMAALQEQDEVTQCYFLLPLMVGCRRTEALTLRWSDLEIDRGVWHKRHTKTDRAQVVPVPQALLERLNQLPRKNAYVFATTKGHWSPSLAFQRWDLIRSRAGLRDVTIHDLRRTLASWLACNGENLAIISNVLNHSSLAHTAIYARLNISPVSRALEENSARIMPTGPSVPSQAMSPLPPRPEIVLPVAEPDEKSRLALSARERELLALLGLGRSVGHIAAAMRICGQSVKKYRTHLMDKLQLKSTGELMRYAILEEARMLRTTPTGHRLTPPVTLMRPSGTDERGGWADYPG